MGGDARQDFQLGADTSGLAANELLDFESDDNESPLTREYLDTMEKEDLQEVSFVAENEEPEVSDPYEHLGKAQKSSEDLDTLLALNKDPKDKILVVIDGKRTEMTVEERAKQLKESIVSEIAEVKRVVDNPAVQGRIDEFFNQNKKEGQELAKELGIDLLKLTPETLKTEFDKSAGNNEKREKIVALAQNLEMREDIERLRRAPEYVRLVEAEYTAKGYTNPNIGPRDEIPRSEYNTAFQLVSEAGRLGGAELRSSNVYLQAESSITMLYAKNQQSRSAEIIKDLGEANKAGKDGDKASKEKSLQHAVELADKINVGFIAEQATQPRNMESGISAELIDIVTIASNARLEYAQFLVEDGRFHEAQGLLNQVKVDSPELLYQQNPRTGEIEYRKHEDKSFERLDQVVTLGVTINPGTFDGAMAKFSQKMQDGDIGTRDGEYSGAYKELASMITARDRIREDVQKANNVLLREKTELNGQLDKFSGAEKRNVLDFSSGNPEKVSSRIEEKGVTSIVVDWQGTGSKSAYIERDGKIQQIGKVSVDEKTGKATLVFDAVLDPAKDKIIMSDRPNEELVERGRVEREISLIDSIVEQRNKNVARIDALTEFSKGSLALSRQDFRNANTYFEAALKADPTLDAELKKLQEKDPEVKTLTELKEATDNTLSGWWERNYKKVALAGAMAAGMLTGVGAIGVASSMGAGIFTTTVIATGSGALAGGLTNFGIHRTVDPNAGYKEFREGAKVGGLSAGLIASPWAARALQAEALAAGTVTVVNTSRIGALANTLGLTRHTVGLGVAFQGGLQTADVIFDDKSIGQAAKDTAMHGAIDSLFFGISSRWGLVKGATDASKVARLTTGQNFANAGRATLFLEGWDSAINLGMYGMMNRMQGKPYYLTEGPGVLLPLIADHYKHNYGEGLDPAHRGDRSLINNNIQKYGPTLGAGRITDRNAPDPTRTVPRGLFHDYSKPPVKPPEKK